MITTPEHLDQLAEILRGCSAEGRPVTPCGSGLHQHLGAPPVADALELRTTALNRVVEYEPADLTAHVEAGLTLGMLQETLARHGQWLPWDPPGGGRATIGGLLAAGRAGPLRLGYGTPRDWVLGMHVALGDGRLVKSGGRVVKNVAGYDAHKLHIGALGTLGVIGSVTFKLAPLPERFISLRAQCPSLAAAIRLAHALRERPLAPVSLAVVAAPGDLAAPQRGAQLLVRFAGVSAAVERQSLEARTRAAGLGVVAEVLEEDGSASTGARDVWRELADYTQPQLSPDNTSSAANEAPVVLRIGVRPSALVEASGVIEAQSPPGSALHLMPGVGFAVARWPALAGDEVARQLARLRAQLVTCGGYAVVEDAPAAVRKTLDLWGSPPATFGMMTALKQQWDPAAILNRGRFVGGI